jgi:hypothetical protein
MSRDITVQWYRGGTDSGHQMSLDLIPMQIDDLSDAEAALYGGEEPYFLYKGFVNTLTYAFRFKDTLINPNETDSITNEPTQYTIIAEPRFRTMSNYVRMTLQKVVGT